MPEDLSAMRLLTVPDVWPPLDCASETAPECPRPTGAALAAQSGDRRAEQADGHAWPRQFAVLLAEALTGVRPVRQILPWLSPRGSVHLHRLLPLFSGGQGARVQRVLTTRPSPDVIEMTLIVAIGPRTRALAVRLTRAEPIRRPEWRERLATRTAEARSAAPPRWTCTDIEAA
ncbi:MAG: Rv3235 family protein [Trebonia sp.]